MTHILHFTITPVQSFIGQSRRTRDLWSSSFLLSWLTGVAMAEILNRKAGRIVFPEVMDSQGNIIDDLLRGILNLSNNAPFIGTLPNRFKAEVNDDFDPTCCVEAVNQKWGELAEQVQQYFLPIELMKKVGAIPRKKSNNPNAQNKPLTQTLWEQQVKHFWDIQWVMCPGSAEDASTANDARWLDLRKNWRQHIQPDQQEAGDACTLMPGWVELSGHVRSVYKDKQEIFWQAVRDHIPTAHREGSKHNPGPGYINLRKDERLCAVAFIKRLWPKLPHSQITTVFNWIPDQDTKSGGNWPSTACMAALPWVKAIYHQGTQAQQTQCQAYVEALNSAHATDMPEKAREGLFSEKLNQLTGIDNKEYFDTLDGRLFYEEGLQAAVKDKFLRDTELPKLQKALGELHKHGKPSPFYAVLRMDGDSVGELINGNASEVSLALKDFADQVKNIVDANHGGATLYAGGDDVLALLSLDQALPCALALQAAYAAAMANKGLTGTISAAIVFAHYHLPLSFVMSESDKLLNDVAKDGNGRNSLAVLVHKPGGQHLQWGSRWDAQDAPDKALEPVATLRALACPADSQALPLSSGFIYRIRERWGELTDDDHWLAPEFKPDYVQKLWAVDLLANRDLGRVTPEARQQATTLAQQLFTISRDQENHPLESARSPLIRLTEDGALLVRFLLTEQQGGKE